MSDDMREGISDGPSGNGTSGEDDVAVTDNPAAHRVEITVDGALAGFVVYHRKGGRALFVHTEIRPEYEGRGLGSRLARGALDVARAHGEPVVPLCPFIAAYIERHPDYADLVDTAVMTTLETPG